MALAGVQHVLTLFGVTTLVPLIFGPAMGMDVLQVAAFISCVYFGMGVATLIQTHPRLGSGLPIVQGSSFSFIPHRASTEASTNLSPLLPTSA